MHPTDPPAEPPVVATPTGPVRGTWRQRHDGSRSAAFLGVPFAQAPIGDLRFMAPVPPLPWDGVLDATSYGATPQRLALSETTLIPEPSIPGESTLNVNVFTPSPAPADGPGLPVLVWIHGGGFTAGSPASPWYDGAAFTRDGVVTVSISYRLGFDGFGHIEGAPANRGVLDWLLALEWVQSTIAAFGGDPRRVTLAGQSAGGGAVLTLLGMPRAQGLFHAAYCLSGATADVSPVRAQAFSARLATAAGVEPTLDGFRSVDESTLLALQGRTSQTGSRDPLAGARAMLEHGLPLGPVVDGDLLPKRTLESLAEGVGAEVPLVLGATDDEFSVALQPYKRALGLVPTSVLLRRLGLPRDAHTPYRDAIKDTTGAGTAQVVGRYITDRVFRTTVVQAASARQDAATWVYRFAWRSPVSGLAVHCVDVPYFFDCLDAERVDRIAGSAPPQQLADDVHGAAVRFVRDRDPGWPRWSPESRQAMVYDDPSALEREAYADVQPLLDHDSRRAAASN